MDHVHHLTYARLFNEALTDLQGLCEPCHRFVHGLRRRDPKDQPTNRERVLQAIEKNLPPWFGDIFKPR
jgi:5-methylcytosine-specific restriction endonuclease McrA